ncbi:hypothetical protein Ndes2526B_g06789 [Nannochloris sp. 'desiccata']
MLASEGDLNRATVWFKKVAPRPRPQHLKEFLLRVWNRYKDGAIPISARAPPKRRKKINKEEAEHAGDLLLQGTQGRSGWRPLANAKEACYENPELKKMVQQKDVSPTYLWRRAKAENKKLTRSRVVFKPTRLPSFKEKRYKMARTLLRIAVRKRLCYCFLDESTIRLSRPPIGRAIGEKGDH